MKFEEAKKLQVNTIIIATKPEFRSGPNNYPWCPIGTKFKIINTSIPRGIGVLVIQQFYPENSISSPFAIGCTLNFGDQDNEWDCYEPFIDKPKKLKSHNRLSFL